jgi:hypothetical protein
MLEDEDQLELSSLDCNGKERLIYIQASAVVRPLTLLSCTNLFNMSKSAKKRQKERERKLLPKAATG